MALTKENYKERLIDKKISRYLKIFGALSIEGPKWCGKTWTSLNHANSVKYINDDANDKLLAELDVSEVLKGENPHLIDEWQLVPRLWDAVRRECDKDISNGKYILTGSATQKTNKIKHSGAGRICKIRMYTMSLYESGYSSGDVSLTDLFNNRVKNKIVNKLSLNDLANYILCGGFPRNIGINADDAQIVIKSYIADILAKDIHDIDEKRRDTRKMEMLMKSLARNECTLASNETLIHDIIENEYDSINKDTVGEYLDVLDRLFLVDNQPAFNPNIRSRDNIGKSSKRHYTDPAFACALLNLNYNKLIQDLNLFGLLFESLVERDLRVYSEYIGGELRHFRNNVTGLEVDAIIVNEDGDYGAIEIKLGDNGVKEAKENLMKYYKQADKKPKFMAIVCGICDTIYKDEETGIFILPITALKP